MAILVGSRPLAEAPLGVGASMSTAKRRRVQRRRADARHVDWLLSLRQAQGSHHTAPGRCCQLLADRVRSLEDLIARFMASKGSAVGSRTMFDGGDAADFVNEAAIAGVREEEASLAESFGAVAAEVSSLVLEPEVGAATKELGAGPGNNLFRDDEAEQDLAVSPPCTWVAVSPHESDRDVEENILPEHFGDGAVKASSSFDEPEEQELGAGPGNNLFGQAAAADMGDDLDVCRVRRLLKSARLAGDVECEGEDVLPESGGPGKDLGNFAESGAAAEVLEAKVIGREIPVGTFRYRDDRFLAPQVEVELAEPVSRGGGKGKTAKKKTAAKVAGQAERSELGDDGLDEALAAAKEERLTQLAQVKRCLEATCYMCPALIHGPLDACIGGQGYCFGCKEQLEGDTTVFCRVADCAPDGGPFQHCMQCESPWRQTFRRWLNS
jgi:hypothetical protein